jgi:hypothetical protein
MNLLNKWALRNWEKWVALESGDFEKYHNLVMKSESGLYEISYKPSIIWNLG